MISLKHNKIKSEIRWTETSFSQSLSEKTGSKIFLKFENRQHTGAFKVRGSYAKLLTLSEEENKKWCHCNVSRKSCTRTCIHGKKNEYYF